MSSEKKEQAPRRSQVGENFLSEVFRGADPETANFMARHAALLERVTVLERALEQIAANEPMDLTAQEIAERVLDA